jgi:hypothetical protein
MALLNLLDLSATGPLPLHLLLPVPCLLLAATYFYFVPNVLKVFLEQS